MTATEICAILLEVANQKEKEHMAHEVDSMFSVRSAPWHLGMKGGTTEKEVAVLAEYPGREEAMRLAGHDFLVQEEYQYRRIERVTDVCSVHQSARAFEGSDQCESDLTKANTEDDCNFTQVSFVKVDGYKFLVSDKSTENNKVLHSARSSYEVVQPEVLYDLTEAILEEDDVQYETAGVLREGAVLWTLARVNKPFYVTGDPSPIYPFVAASTTNDGTGGVKVQNLKTRIVCMNTFGQATRESQDSGREFTFRHTKKVGARIEKVKEILAGANKQASGFQELGEEMVGIVFTDKAIQAFTEVFIPKDPAAVYSERVEANIEEARAKVLATFDSPTIAPEIRNTAYGALQVAVEYQQHLRPHRNNNTYLNRTLLKVESLSDRLIPTIRKIADENKVGALV